MKHDVHVRDRVSHPKTGETSYSVVTGLPPSNKHASVFEWTAYVLKQLSESKFHDKAIGRVLVEVLDHGMYKVLIKEGHDYKIVVSRGVTFDKSRFPGVLDLEEYMNDEADDNTTWCDISPIIAYLYMCDCQSTSDDVEDTADFDYESNHGKQHENSDDLNEIIDEKNGSVQQIGGDDVLEQSIGIGGPHDCEFKEKNEEFQDV